MAEEVGYKTLEMGARLNSGSCGIGLFGGEPLLHRPLMERIVARAREMERAGLGRFHFKITTNGLSLDDDLLNWAVRERILMTMSFDGIREVQDRHRHLPDGSPSYDLLLPRLKALLEAKPYTSIISVVNPDTAQFLTQSVSHLLDLGCRYLIVTLNHAAEWREADFRILDKEYKRLARRYVEWTRRGRKFYLSPFEVKLSSHINSHRYERERCALGQRQLSVDAEGYLYPCVQFPAAGPDSPWQIGTVFDGIDEEALSRIFAESQAEKALCRDCAIRDRCNNTCGCLNWQTTGDINGISPVFCRNEQLLVRYADWIGRTLYKERDPHFINKHYNEAYPVFSAMEDKAAKRARERPAP